MNINTNINPRNNLSVLVVVIQYTARDGAVKATGHILLVMFVSFGWVKKLLYERRHNGNFHRRREKYTQTDNSLAHFQLGI